MTVKEVFERAHWPGVAIALVSVNPSRRKSIPIFEVLFSQLRRREPLPSDCELVIENAEINMPPVKRFHHVYVKHREDNRHSTLSYTPWPEWLGMVVCERTLSSFSLEQIAADCILEMTLWGITEESIERAAESFNALTDVGIYQDKQDEMEPDEGNEEISRKGWLEHAGRWLKWSAISTEYFGESAAWFRKHFLEGTNPDDISELDLQTLKAALKEIGDELFFVSNCL